MEFFYVSQQKRNVKPVEALHFFCNCTCPNVSFLFFQAEDTRVQKAIEQILVEHSDILNRKTDGT